MNHKQKKIMLGLALFGIAGYLWNAYKPSNENKCSQHQTPKLTPPHYKAKPTSSPPNSNLDSMIDHAQHGIPSQILVIVPETRDSTESRLKTRIENSIKGYISQYDFNNKGTLYFADTLGNCNGRIDQEDINGLYAVLREYVRGEYERNPYAKGVLTIHSNECDRIVPPTIGDAYIETPYHFPLNQAPCLITIGVDTFNLDDRCTLEEARKGGTNALDSCVSIGVAELFSTTNHSAEYKGTDSEIDYTALLNKRIQNPGCE